MTIFTKAIDFVLPPRCVHCGVKIMDDGALCANCWSGLKHISDPQCHCCGLPFAFHEGDESLCGACIKDTPSFTWARSPLYYNDISQSLVTSLKFGKRLENAPLIANMLLQVARDKLKNADALIPVPLHRRRLLKRHFNQAGTIAQHVSKRCGIALDFESLIRVKPTVPQVGLTRRERQKNVRGAFKVKDKNLVTGKNLILIDDVYTTGATVEAAAKTLKKAGASEIGILTFARRLKSD